MNRYRVGIHIVPRRGILDPQGKTVAEALHALGFGGVADARIGRHIMLDVDATSESEAANAVEQMCERLLANPVTEDYEIATVSTV
ncbi:MAG TPA: phosphoribosylformylglycinamidine synthase subunit PurS [Gemmatimonadaceae bacterium]|nr:phosphoribosylformylglycinamidine synthase subunit PurS [Gemmatimonadaceae bacterium]